MSDRPFSIIDLEPNTPEWHSWREGKLTASGAGVIMGAVPRTYEVHTWDDLRMQMMGLGPEPEGFTIELFAHGHKAEAQCRDALFPHFLPVIIESHADPRFTATLDGMAELPDTGELFWLEIKSPHPRHNTNSSTWKQASKSGNAKQRIQPMYWWQLVHQAMVIGPEANALCKFVVYLSPRQYQVIDVPYRELEADIPALLEQWEAFADGELQGNHAVAWLEAASEWKAAEAAAKEADARLKDARQSLIDLSPDEDTYGGGVDLKHITSKGSVKWKDLAEACLVKLGEDVALDDWRGPDRKSSRVTRIKDEA